MIRTGNGYPQDQHRAVAVDSHEWFVFPPHEGREPNY